MDAVDPQLLEEWNAKVKLKERLDDALETIHDVRALVKACQYGEEKHTMDMLRELLGV